MLKNYYSTIKYILTFGFLITIYYLSRYHGFNSELEIKLWGNLHLLNDNNQMYYFLSNTPPLSIYNIINIYRLTFFNLTIFAPFFLGLISLFATIYFRNKSSKSTKSYHSLILIIFSINPYVLNIICNDLVSLLTAIILVLIFKGIRLYSIKRSSKGIFLVAIGLAVLLSSAEIGVTNFIAVFLLIPLLLRQLFQRKEFLGPLMLFVFPSAATILGITYLSWLSNIDINKLIFMNGKLFQNFTSLSQWSVFIPVLIFRYRLFHKNILEFINRNYGIIIPFLGHVTLILLDRDYSPSAFLSIALIITALKMLSSKTNTKIMILSSLYLTSISWISLNYTTSSQTQDFLSAIIDSNNYKNSQDHEVQDWVNKKTNGKSIILSGDHHRISMFDDSNNMTTPASRFYQKSFNFELQTFDQIIISKSELDNFQNRFNYTQDKSNMSYPNFSIVFSSPKWNILRKNDKSAKPYDMNSSYHNSFNSLFLKELLYMLIIFDLILVCSIFFNSRRNNIKEQ